MVCLGLFCISQSGCGQPAEKTNLRSTLPQHTTSLQESRQPALTFDSTRIAPFFSRFPKLKPYEQNIKNFYSKRGYKYAWFKEDGLVEQAAFWSNRFLNPKSDGVYKHFFYQQTLDSLIDKQKVKSKTVQPDLSLELLLSSLYFQYSKIVWTGMDDAASRSANWLIPRKRITYEDYLDSLLKTPVNRPLPQAPVYRQYELLKSQLRKYETLQRSGAWKPIVATKNASEIGERSTLVVNVKRRLYRLEDFRGDTLNNLYDHNLVSAIERFQRRHGLKADGRLNPQTIAELNIPIERRIQQIVVNMERSRWLPLQTSGDHIAVNIPEFKLHVYRGDSLLWSCNAVVGKTIHPTVQFYGEIKYVVFSPYWNVPPGILRNEILPALKKDPNYLVKHNMEITGYRNGIPVIRQKPGKSNPLGLVKFLFPNSYNIYLHDTPSKSLFNEASRAFSHGCIRISEPEKLAAHLLSERTDWNPGRIRSAMQGGKERQVTLDKPIPVFIAYFTAFVDRENRLNFRKDIYNLDDRLAEMIMAGDGDTR